MKKTLILLLSLLLATSSAYAALGKETKGPFGYNLYDDIHRNDKNKTENAEQNKTDDTEKTDADGSKSYSNNTEPAWLTETVYYPKATIESAINKYKKGNYSGCLQEMISLVKKDPTNPVVYYYMAMAYSRVGNKEQAVRAYEEVIKLNPDAMLTQYATKGRDCLIGGPACVDESEAAESDTPLDIFIKAPYGNGFSEELNQQFKLKQLENIQKTINNKEELDQEDIEEIQEFDSKSELLNDDKLAANTVSDDEILSAIQTLKDAGVTVSITPQAMPNQYNDYSMLLQNNNNNNNAMMNMVPFLLNQYQNGEKIDPQIIQSMMMNSMLPDFTMTNDNKNY